MIKIKEIDKKYNKVFFENNLSHKIILIIANINDTKNKQNENKNNLLLLK